MPKVQQLLEQRSGDVALVGEQLAKQAPHEFGHGFAVVHVARREREIEQFALVIEDQRPFEAKEPAERTFAAGRQSRKDLVHGLCRALAERGAVQPRHTGCVKAPMMADRQRSRIQK